jgi:hypothetical protein
MEGLKKNTATPIATMAAPSQSQGRRDWQRPATAYNGRRGRQPGTGACRWEART